MKIRAVTATDFYKTGHKFQYPEGTELVYSNFTCRSDKWFNAAPGFDHRVVVAGMQGICQWLLRDLWNDTFFNRPKAEVLAYYKRRMDGALGAGAVPVDHIADLHDLGHLPILVKALPEGSRVNMRVPLWTIRNTIPGPKWAWLTNYLETQLSAEAWKPITSATTAFEFRRLIDYFADLTGGSKEFVDWQGHDFAFRGLSGIYDAAMSGASHLLSFKGTDTISAIDYLEDHYSGADTFIGGSVAATEHSVMCAGGEEGELDTIGRLLTKVYPGGIVSIVSDTWDFWHVINDTAVKLKDVIMGRNGKTVFRPDSGDPVKIICGDPDAVPNSPEQKGAVQCLWDIFGGTYTRKGFKTLDSHVGLIYGDSINLDRAQRILDGLARKGFASDNIVFGVGSYTYQGVTRDTLGTAIKATYAEINGVPRELWKAPKTDSGVKHSARGLLRVEKEGNVYRLYERQTWEQEGQGLLAPLFCNGMMRRHETLDGIRTRLHEEAAESDIAMAA